MADADTHTLSKEDKAALLLLLLLLLLLSTVTLLSWPYLKESCRIISYEILHGT
jgi:hypothetical protein